MHPCAIMIKQRNISPCISHAGKMGNFIQGKYKGHTLSAANGTAYHSTLEMTPWTINNPPIFLVRCPLPRGNYVRLMKTDMEIWEPPHVKCFIWLALPGQNFDSQAPSKERCAAHILCDQTSETTGHHLVDCPSNGHHGMRCLLGSNLWHDLRQFKNSSLAGGHRLSTIHWHS
jgi:hypothetical protein